MKIQTTLAAATAALLITGCASDQQFDKQPNNKTQDDNALGQCHGINSCKGKSACATAESSCVGNNACKGKGWVQSNPAECEAKGGKFKPL